MHLRSAHNVNMSILLEYGNSTLNYKLLVANYIIVYLDTRDKVYLYA